jgi:hypothetical protein
VTVVAFLEARLAEDEQEFAGVDHSDFWLGTADLNEAWIVGIKTRMRRENKAKRATLNRHALDRGADILQEEADLCQEDAHGWPCPTIRDMAEVYCDHPDYEERWRP